MIRGRGRLIKVPDKDLRATGSPSSDTAHHPTGHLAWTAGKPSHYPGITGLGTLGQRGYVIAGWALAKRTGLQSIVTWFWTYRVHLYYET